MRASYWQIVCIAFLCAPADLLLSEEDPKEDVVPLVTSLAFLDIANSKNGSYPGGSTPKKGKWFVDSESKSLKIEVEPLVEGWLEFGPEVREKPATIAGGGRAPSEDRIHSRFGVGLYGPNGFQLRIAVGREEIELVRRGEILKRVSKEMDSSQLFEMELSVVEEGEDWMIKGRVWDMESLRPEEPTIEILFPADELLFPLAGRPVLVATPFSGKPVAFVYAKVFDGPIPSEEEESEESETVDSE